MSKPKIDPKALQAVMAAHLGIYQHRTPSYQAELLNSLAELWPDRPARVLDVGGGTGVLAEAIAKLLPVGTVCTIDINDRFSAALTVEARVFDGHSIPYPDDSFDAATLINVVHHVPSAERAGLLREIRRVVDGPLLVKDHLSLGWLDDCRLAILDVIGNIPFGGMVAARYLAMNEWNSLAAASGWRIGLMADQRGYRSGPMGIVFPNRLEVTFRLEPAST